MSSIKKNRDKMWFTVKIISVIHRLLEFAVRGILLLVAYLSGPAETQPPIKDLTLLHSATALATKVRNKQVSYMVVSVVIFPTFINLIFILF